MFTVLVFYGSYVLVTLRGLRVSWPRSAAHFLYKWLAPRRAERSYTDTGTKRISYCQTFD